MEDMERLEGRLRGKDREIVELEMEIERLKKDRGNVVIERIIKEQPPPPPEVIIQKEPVEKIVYADPTGELVRLRSDLLHLTRENNVLQDELNYLRVRGREQEIVGDRTISLLAHQN